MCVCVCIYACVCVGRADTHTQAYLQATREGKTPQAQKDLQRLAELKAKREAGERKKQQEAKEREDKALAQKRIAIAGGRKPT